MAKKSKEDLDLQKAIELVQEQTKLMQEAHDNMLKVGKQLDGVNEILRILGIFLGWIHKTEDRLYALEQLLQYKETHREKING